MEMKMAIFSYGIMKKSTIKYLQLSLYYSNFFIYFQLKIANKLKKFSKKYTNNMFRIR
jgi:hypothetical protein